MVICLLPSTLVVSSPVLIYSLLLCPDCPAHWVPSVHAMSLHNPSPLCPACPTWFLPTLHPLCSNLKSLLPQLTTQYTSQCSSPDRSGRLTVVHSSSCSCTWPALHDPPHSYSTADPTFIHSSSHSTHHLTVIHSSPCSDSQPSSQ
jgi:hypothetical protein